MDSITAVDSNATDGQSIMFEYQVDLPSIKQSEYKYEYPSYSAANDLFKHYGI